jgi:general secretion pathway protein G
MLRKLRERSETEGFTLIELLIVITILGILAAIVVFAVGTTGSNATTAACQSDVKTVETALEASKAQAGSYDATIAALITDGYLRDAPPAAATDKYTVTTDGTGGVVVGGTSVVGGTLTPNNTTLTAQGVCKSA